MHVIASVNAVVQSVLLWGFIVLVVAAGVVRYFNLERCIRFRVGGRERQNILVLLPGKAEFLADGDKFFDRVDRLLKEAHSCGWAKVVSRCFFR